VHDVLEAQAKRLNEDALQLTLMRDHLKQAKGQGHDFASYADLIDTNSTHVQCDMATPVKASEHRHVLTLNRVCAAQCTGVCLAVHP
jgi:hypothetical protein